MIRWLSKLLNIQSGEWPRVILLCLILAIPNAGIIWGSTITYATFLKQVGVGALPWVLVISSLLSILALAVYSAFVDRIPDSRLLLAIFFAGALCIVVGLGIFWSGYPGAAYSFLYLILLAWLAVANPHLTTYTNSFYDVQAAKRIYPVVLGAGLGGSILAGLAMPFVNTWLRPEGIIIIWLASYVLAMLVIWLMPYLLKTNIHPSEAHITAAASGLEQIKAQDKGRSLPPYLNNIREGLHYTSQSSYLLWIAASSLLLMIFMAFLEYRSSQLLTVSFETSQAFADYTGLLNGVANLIILPMLIMGISRLIARFGLGNVSLIFPATNLLIALGLVRFPGLYSASASYLNRKALRTSFQVPIDSLLYNAVPLRIRGRARAFVSGLILPVGSLIGGLLLLLPIGKTTWFISIMLGVLALAYLACAFIIRKQYSQALVRMLHQEDYSFLLSQEASDLPVADPDTLKRLQNKLETSTGHELKVFMTRLIAQLGGNQAVPILGPTIQSTPDANTRSAMLDVLAASGIRSVQLRQLYTTLLNDPASQVRLSAINGLESLADIADQQFLSHMLDTIEDPDPQVRTRALSTLARSDRFYEYTPAVEALDRMLIYPEPGQRAYGISVLGKIDHPRAILAVMDYLDDPVDQVRLEAALSIEEMAVRRVSTMRSPGIGQGVIEKMGLRLGFQSGTPDPIERVRLAAVTTLAAFGHQSEARQALLASLTDPSPQVRAATVDALIACGKEMIPLVQAELESTDLQMRKMAAMALSRANPRQFGEHISANIADNLDVIYANYAQIDALAALQTPTQKFRGLSILQNALSEKNQQLADEILYQLTALHDPASIHAIGDSLRSESARVRANAAEALETITSPHTARLVAPLFQPGITPSRLLAIRQDSTSPRPLLAETPVDNAIQQEKATQAIRQLASSDDQPWLQAIAVFALGEIGAALKPTKAETEPSRQPTAPGGDTAAPASQRRAGRRAFSGDLLAALSDNSVSQDKPKREPETANQTVSSDSPASVPSGLQFTEIEAMIASALQSPHEEVRLASQSACQAIAGRQTAAALLEDAHGRSAAMLSIIDRIIFLKEVPFFQDMTVDQLKILASVCEEKLYEQDTRIFNKGDPGGVLYVVINGKVGIEHEKRTGSFARLADIAAYSYFGETNFFDNTPNATSAVAIQDTLTLQLRREPLIALARQNPELSLKLINTLSQRLREANDRIAELTRSMPRELHKLFDQYE